MMAGRRSSEALHHLARRLTLRLRTILLGAAGVVAFWVLVVVMLNIVICRDAKLVGVVTEGRAGDGLGSAIVCVPDITHDGIDDLVLPAMSVLGVGGRSTVVVDGRFLLPLREVPTLGDAPFEVRRCTGHWLNQPATLIGQLSESSLVLLSDQRLDEQGALRVALPDRSMVRSFCWIGDVDADGISDLALLDEGLTGEAEIVLWSTGLGLALASISLGHGNSFNTELHAIGDVDGDRLPDFVDSYIGTVTLRSGRDGRLLGQLKGGSSFGTSVVGCDDWNLDGVPDIAIGEPNEQYGKVHVVSGRDLKTLRVVEGQERFSGFGTDIECTIGLTPDGRSALVILAANGRRDRITIVTRDGGRQGFGVEPRFERAWSMACIDDIDGDGLREIAIGFPNPSPPHKTQPPGYICIYSIGAAVRNWFLD